MNNPDVTILMSVHNAGKYLAQSVESILQQSYPNFIFLIIDDGSTDNSISYLQKLNDKRIRLVLKKQNQGLTKRLIEGLNLINTDFFARMDADDIADPDRLKIQRNYLLSHKEIVLIGCNYTKIGETGKTIGKSDFPLAAEKVRESIFISNPLSHSCFFGQTHLIKKNGGYNPKFYFSQDYELVLRLAFRLPVANVPENLMFDRQNQNSITQKNRFPQAWYYFLAQLRGLLIYHYPLKNCIYLLKTLGYLAKSAIESK